MPLIVILSLGPPEPTFFSIWGIFIISNVCLIQTYHSTKVEQSSCLWLLRKSRPFILKHGPLGLTNNYLQLWVCKCSVRITTQNQSQVAALVAKIKRALNIWI